MPESLCSLVRVSSWTGSKTSSSIIVWRDRLGLCDCVVHLRPRTRSAYAYDGEVEILTAEQTIMSVYIDADSGSVMTTEEKITGNKPAQEKKS